MKLGSSLFLGASSLLSLGLAATLSVQGCSSSNSTTTTTPNDGGGSGSGGASGSGGSGSGSGGTDGGSSSGGGYTPVVPPASPTGGTATTFTTPHNFALHHIHMGEEAAPNDAAHLGYDIDGKDTTATSTDVCTNSGGKKAQADYSGGIDNSFGLTILPVLSAVAADPSTSITNSILGGGFTLMVNVTGFDTSSTLATQSNTGLTAQLFGGAKFSATDAGIPTFTTADNWPLNPAFLSSQSPITPKVVFNSAYVNNGTFVSGSPTEIQISITISGYPLTLDVKHAVVTFQHDQATNATKGIISGVLVTTDFLTALGAVAGAINVEACPGTSVFDTLTQTIQGAADIMQDGTNTAGAACDAISIGLGFDADEIGQPQVVGTETTNSSNPCDDAGATTPEAGTGTDAAAEAGQ